MDSPNPPGAIPNSTSGSLLPSMLSDLLSAMLKTSGNVLHFSRGMPYMVMLSATNLTTLASRREENIKEILHSHLSTYFLLTPPPRDHSVISRLRTYEKYPQVFTRTKRHCSLIII